MLKELYQKIFSPKIDLSQSNLDKAVIKKYNLTRGIKQSAAFCHAPFTNMLFSQDGNVYACCHNKKTSIGRYPQQSISEIWNSKSAQQYRHMMEQYIIPDACQVCTSDFKGEAFKEMKSLHFDSLKPHAQYPVMMEFLLSNKCNLECVMCNGESSSLIRKNREKLSPIPSAYDDAFIEQLKEFIPHLKEARFSSSGEAFSIDTYLTIWNLIIDLNPDCLIVIQTNGTILNDRIKQILQRGNFQIGISLDSLKKDVFESIRINANFDKVIKNIEYFRDYSVAGKRKFDLSMCVMRNNWQEAADFIRYCNQNHAVANLHKVWYPIDLAIYNLPKKELENIYQFLYGQELPDKTDLERHNKKHYSYYVDIVRHWADSAFEGDTVYAYTNKYESIQGFSECIKRISSYIHEQRDLKDKEFELEVFKNKFYTLFEILNDAQLQSYAIQHSSYSPAHEFYSYIRFQSSEFLAAQFKRLIEEKNKVS